MCCRWRGSTSSEGGAPLLRLGFQRLLVARCRGSRLVPGTLLARHPPVPGRLRSEVLLGARVRLTVWVLKMSTNEATRVERALAQIQTKVRQKLAKGEDVQPGELHSEKLTHCVVGAFLPGKGKDLLDDCGIHDGYTKCSCHVQVAAQLGVTPEDVFALEQGFEGRRPVAPPNTFVGLGQLLREEALSRARSR